MRADSAQILFKPFLRGQGYPLFDVVHSAFPLPTSASPALQGAPKDSFADAVVACHARTMQVSVSGQLPEEVPVDPKEVDLHAEQFPQTLSFENLHGS